MAANEETDLIADDCKFKHVVVDGIHRLTAFYKLCKCQEADVAAIFLEVPF